MAFQIRKAEHDVFYDDVREYLARNGYVTVSATYHDIWPVEVAELLRVRSDITSLYTRFRSDNIAVAEQANGAAFQWDAKTNISVNLPNMALEALPVAIHKSLSDVFGVRCLYAYYDVPRKRHAGFWVAAMPPIKTIMLPADRWTNSELDNFHAIFARLFAGIPIRVINQARGSGTPFLIIEAQHVQALPHWRTLISNA